MSVRVLPAPKRSRMLVGLLLALLAQGLWLRLLWVDHRQVPLKGTAPLEMRLLAPKPEPMPRPPPPPSPPPTVHGAAMPAVPRLAAPVAVESAEPLSVTAGPVPAAAAAPATPSPLRLSLPAERPASGPRSPSMLDQVLNDPRANGGKRGVEFAIADAAGTLPVITQASTDGTSSRLIRQGSKCLRVREFRGKTLDPMSENSKNAAALVGTCVSD